MQHQSLGGAGGGMPLSDLQRMQQTLQAYGRQPQQGQASLAGMGVPNSMQQQQQQFHTNPQFVAMAQQQGRGMKSPAVPAANTALAVMQQGNSVSQGHSSMSHAGGNHGNSNAMYNNWNSMQGNNMNCAGGGGVSSMDATTGSSARLMAMAGMGMGMNPASAAASKPVGDASMQNMQALFEMQQQQQQQLQNQGMSMSTSSAGLSTFNGQNMSAGNHQSLMGHNQDPSGVVPNNQQQQLLLQRQLASIQKQMQSRQVSSSGSVGPTSQVLPQQSGSAINGMVQVGGQSQAASQAAMLQARQQHLLKQMQQQQSGGANVGMMNQLANSMQQDPNSSGNSMMGMMQQMSGIMQQRRISGSSNSMMGNQPTSNSSHMDASALGMGSLNEQRLRMRQQNILRGSSNSQSMGADAQAVAPSLQMNSGHHSASQSLQGNMQGGHVNHNASLNSMQFPNAQQQVASHLQSNQIDMNAGQFGRQVGSGMNDNSSHSQISSGSGNANNVMMPIGQQQDVQKSFLDGSFAGGWQSNDDIPDRRRIILSILDVVRQMRPDSSKMSTKLPHMAKSLEEHLYRSAQTKEEYLNLSTLKTRLQAIAQGLELHRSTSTSDGVQQRMQIPQGTGGNQNFDGSNAHQSPAFPVGLGTLPNSQASMSQQQNASWSDTNANVPYGLANSSQVTGSHLGNVQLVGQGNMSMQQGMFRQGQMSGVQNTGEYGMDHNINVQQQNGMWSSSAQSAHGNDDGFLSSANMLQSGMTNLPNQNVVPQMDQGSSALPQHMMNVLGQQSNAVDMSSGSQVQDSSSWNSVPSGAQSAPSNGNVVNNEYPNTPKYQDQAAAQKKKVILQQQQRLLLLRHASKCKAGPDCTTKFCSQMITLWKHMKTCRDRHCKTSHCLSSRCVLNHYRICKSNGRTPTCEVCGPVMAKIKQQERDSANNDPLAKDQDGTQGAVPDASRQQESSSQQLKLQTHFESLQELQRQQQHLIEQQSRLREQAQQIADPSTQQARQLKEQQALLSQLQQRCQEQQRLIHQELQNNVGSSVGNDFQNQVSGALNLELGQFQQNDLGNSLVSSTVADKVKSVKAARVQNQAKKTGGKGRRSGKGKAFSVALEGVAQSINSEPKKRASSVVVEKERPAKKQKESGKHPEPVPVPKVVSSEDKKEAEPADLHTTSLIPFMTREAIAKHLESLNKRIRLSSRTVTHKCLPLVQNLLEDQFGWVFQDAVDPVALGLPDYFDVVKNPMHLELVKKKLENAVYSEMEDVARDVRLVFENAILYNGESSEVGGLAQTMLNKFDKLYQDMIQDVENSQKKLESNGEACSLCGGQKRLFEPTILYCRGNCGMQRIKRQATYYTDRTKQNHWCDACYAMLEPDEVIVLDDNSEIRKSDLQEFKNDALPEEPWVNCDDCGSWVHQICSLFNGRKNKSHSKYTCPTCYVKNYNGADVVRSEKFMKGAEDLPKCKMSTAIESGLMQALAKSYATRASELNVTVDDVEKAEGLTVRVVSNVEKRHLVGEKMRERYSGRGCPTEFPVRTKCIALFQKIHGVDTFLFALYVYEYGQDAPAPNRRRVYISYLDSVQYFEPKCYRTTVYHTILVEYLRYVKNRGFHTAHIWSCPPTPGDDYIFYCHPSHQLTPREDMLRSWYQKMLERAKAQGIVIRTSTLYDEYFGEDSVDGVPVQRDDPTCLPYFEGDYIPGEIENIIKMQEKRFAQEGESLTQPSGDEVMLRLRHNLGKMKDNFIVVHLRNRRFAAAVERGEDVSEWMEDSDEEVVRSKRAKISGKDSSALLSDANATADPRISHSNSSITKSGDGTGNRLISQDPQSTSTSTSAPEPEVLVSSTGDPDFQTSSTKQGLDEIKPAIKSHFSGIDRLDRLVADTTDVDEPVENEMFESRQLFLNYCQTNHCQFDELRRAKHSTMMVLFQLHNPMAPKFLQQCGACYCDLIHGIRYHCNNCSNFDLCSECYEPVTSGRWAQRDARFAHDSSHSFTPVDIESVEEPKKSQDDKQKSLRVHIELLEHAAMCPGSPECSLSNCERMKQLFLHVRSCDVKPKKDCKICTRLLALCSMHARMCTASVECSIPFCDRIRERNSRLRRQQELMDDRRRQAQNELYHTGSKS